MAARTLLSVMRDRSDPFEAGMIYTFLDSCDVSKILPMVTINRTQIGHRRSNSASTVGFRARGERFGGVTERSYDEVQDATYPIGAEIDVDITDMRDKSLTENPMVKATREAMEDMSFTFRNHFINGDQATEPDGFEGLIVRLQNLASSQTVYALDSSNELDISKANITSTTARQFLDAWDDAQDACDGHKADVVFTTSSGIRAIKRCLRILNLYRDVAPETPRTDAGNRRQSSADPLMGANFVWDNVRIYDMGYKADQTNTIIATESFSGATCTPFYFTKLGSPKYLYGIQQYEIEISDTNLLDDNVTYRTTVDWPVGLHHVHPRFGVKLKGAVV